MTARSLPLRASLGRLRPGRTGLGEGALATAAALVCGIAASQSLAAGLLILALLAGGLTVLILGRLALPVLLLLVVPQLGNIGAVGIDLDPLQPAAAFTLAVIGSLAYSQDSQRMSRAVRGVIGALLVVTLLGAVAAVANATSFQDLAALAATMAGQPLLYAVILFVLVAAASDGPRERRLMVWALLLALALQLPIAAWELGSGAAYDPIRDVSRVGGSIGINFLGAFASIGVFIAAWAREQSSSHSTRMVAAACIAVGLLLALLTVSRGSLVAVLLALAYLLASGLRRSGRREAIVAVALIGIALAGALYATAGLWEQRLDSPEVSAFDRPATWVSGLKIAIDHPLAGVGSTALPDTVGSDLSYSSTSLGETAIIPHNSWIYALAAGGLPYGLALVTATGLFAHAIARRRRERSDRYLVAALIAASAIFMINNTFTHVEVMLPTLLAGALLLVPKHEATLAAESRAEVARSSTSPSSETGSPALSPT